jgi:hypothetical protein
MFDMVLTPTQWHQFEVGVQTVKVEAVDVAPVDIKTTEIQEDHKCCHTESSAEESPVKCRKL